MTPSTMGATGTTCFERLTNSPMSGFAGAAVRSSVLAVAALMRGRGPRGVAFVGRGSSANAALYGRL